MPEKLKEDIINGIYNGTYHPERLPKKLYEQTADKLKESVYNGFKSSLKDAEGEKLEMLIDLRENIYMFAAAKTFQNVSELTDALYDEKGIALSFNEFKEFADAIYEKYNEDWQDAEEDSASVAARSAEQWVDIQNEKKDYPYLIYAVDEETACDICEPLDGIALPIDDPFWEENATPQHYYCNCTIGQLDENDIEEIQGVSTQEEVDKALEISGKEKSGLFNFNPGKDRVIFQDEGKDKHPYFDVPEEYKEFAKENFGLQIPEDDN